jgi:peptide/nickel transport system permease protein
MIGYILRRLLATIPVLLVVAVLVFLMLRLTPGDPAAVIAGDNATSAQIAMIRTQLGLDKPILTQFAIWSGNLLTGNFGESFFFKKTVAELIVGRLEPTVSLAITTMVLAVLVAVPLGVLAAYKHGTWIDRIVMGFSVLGFSVPVFVIGYALIYIFAITLNWLPIQGYQPLSGGFWGFLQRLILPSVTLSVIYVALIARMTRASVLEVLGEDYIRTARAKGQVERKILFRHALKNAAVPIVTVIGIGVALLIGGVVVTESVFSIPGLGRLTVDAVLARDYPTIQAVILCSRSCTSSSTSAWTSPTRCSTRGSGIERRACPACTGGAVSGARAGFRRVAAPVPPALRAHRRRRAARHRHHRHSRPDARDDRPGRDQSVLPQPRARDRAHDPPGRRFHGSVHAPDGHGFARARHLQPGDLRGAGLAHHRRLRRGDLHRDRPRPRAHLRLCPLARRRHHAPHGRADGDPGHPARHRGRVALPGRARCRHPRDHGAGDPARRTARALHRAVRARGALCGGRHHGRHAHAEADGAPHPAEHDRALIVQGTFICGSAMLVEAILSFLGIGIPPETPTWGNIMAEGRNLFRIYPHNILYPGIFLGLTVLAVNMLGDGLRDTLDPKMAGR